MSLTHNPNLIDSNKNISHFKQTSNSPLPVNGWQSNILKRGQYCSALFEDVHIRCSKQQSI
jgi:hypothetical protein